MKSADFFLEYRLTAMRMNITTKFLSSKISRTHAHSHTHTHSQKTHTYIHTHTNIFTEHTHTHMHRMQS